MFYICFYSYFGYTLFSYLIEVIDQLYLTMVEDEALNIYVKPLYLSYENMIYGLNNHETCSNIILDLEYIIYDLTKQETYYNIIFYDFILPLTVRTLIIVITIILFKTYKKFHNNNNDKADI